MIHVQRALRSGELTLATLAEKFGISGKRHREFPNLVQFTYDQIKSPVDDPLVSQCRGLILDEGKNWNVVAYPFDRFFNNGEPGAAPIDWSTARVQEKLDGSLIIAYWYAGAWRAATKGTPDAGGFVNSTSMTFGDLFWKSLGFEKVIRDWLSGLPRHVTFMFELQAPENRIVTRTSGRRVTLIGARDRNTELEFDAREIAPEWMKIREFPLASIDDALATFASMDPLEQEGYVVVDAKFNRIKVKHPGYVALHHLRGNGPMTPKRALEVILTNEAEEVMSSFPEFGDIIRRVGARIDALLEDLCAGYSELSEDLTQKEFAFAVRDSRCSAALFQLRSGRVHSIGDFLLGMNPSRLYQILNLEELNV